MTIYDNAEKGRVLHGFPLHINYLHALYQCKDEYLFCCATQQNDDIHILMVFVAVTILLN